MTEPGITPSQTAGPYLRDRPPAGHRHPERRRSRRRRARSASGAGSTDAAGDGVPDGMVETWQANAAGRYHHPADERDDLPLEDGFPASAAPGRRTTAASRSSPSSPGACRGRRVACRRRTSMSRSSRAGCSSARVTRLYFPDETEANADGPGALAACVPSSGDTLVAVAEDGGLRFDIRLQGPSHTTFFAV